LCAGGLSLVLWGMAACSGQGKADKAAVVADSVVIRLIKHYFYEAFFFKVFASLKVFPTFAPANRNDAIL